MKPVKGNVNHDPDNGTWGDCHRAAVASLLELPLEKVPHFGDGGPDAEEFTARERRFLSSLGLWPVYFAYKDTPLEAIQRYMKLANPGVYYLLGGTSRLGTPHTVVGLDDEIVHDPSRVNSGIVGPMADGVYWVTVVVDIGMTNQP
jgi:hypothetical protein